MLDLVKILITKNYRTGKRNIWGWLKSGLWEYQNLYKPWAEGGTTLSVVLLRISVSLFYYGIKIIGQLLLIMLHRICFFQVRPPVSV